MGLPRLGRYLIFGLLWGLYAVGGDELVCLHSCSAALKSSLVSIVGNSPEVDVQLLAPLHTVVSRSGSTTITQRKIGWLCHSVDKYAKCLSGCPDTKEKAVRDASLQQWRVVCGAFSAVPTVFMEFVRCLRTHQDGVEKKCPPLQLIWNVRLESFCRSLPTKTYINVSRQLMVFSLLRQYTTCYASVPFRCSPNATELWLNLNDSVMQSYHKLQGLSSEHLRIPDECGSAMRNLAHEADSPQPFTPTKDPRQRNYAGTARQMPTTTAGPKLTNQRTVSDPVELADYWTDEEFPKAASEGSLHSGLTDTSSSWGNGKCGLTTLILLFAFLYLQHYLFLHFADSPA